MDGPIDEAVSTVRSDGERGSEAISQDALEGLARHLEDAPAGSPGELRDSTREAARELAQARPSMPVVASKVAAAWRRLASAVPYDAGLEELRQEGAAVVRGLADEAAGAREEAAEAAAEVLVEADPVVTLSRSSTVREALAGLGARVHVLESRPGGEGAGFAAGLREAGVDADVAPDAYAAGLLQETGADAVVVGADGITRQGAVVNKVGTRTLAAAARHADVPVWVVSSTWKAAPAPTGREAADWGAGEAPAHDVPLLEETPADLLAGIATERGPLRPREAAEVAGRRAKDLADLGVDVG